MARKILIQAEPYKDSFKLTIPSEYNKLVVKDMVLKQKVRFFELNPRIKGSKSQSGYLEGAVVYVYAKWQYNLDPRDPSNEEDARNLFKSDFWYKIVKKRDGTPEKSLLSFKGRKAEVLDKYTSWAQENGAPIPNEKLYLIWQWTDGGATTGTSLII